MPLKVLRNSNLNELFALAADALISELGQRQGKSILALPGGRSVVGLLDALSSKSTSLWSRLEFFMVDERLVPLTDKESNFKLLNEKIFTSLVSKGLIAESQIHPFLYRSNLDDCGLAAYEQELRKCGGRFHAAVLGVGEDAHVGALFPKHHSIKDEANLFLKMSDSPKPPPARMTASKNLLSGVDISMALFIGEGKREALERFFDDSLSLEDCPAKILLNAKQSFIVTDLD